MLDTPGRVHPCDRRTHRRAFQPAPLLDEKPADLLRTGDRVGSEVLDEAVGADKGDVFANCARPARGDHKSQRDV